MQPGGRGELVLTSLTKEAMPLIRYRIGDITSIREDKLKAVLNLRTVMELVERGGDFEDCGGGREGGGYEGGVLKT